MSISSTITAINKYAAELKELREKLESITAAADPQEITPAQLMKALDILTYCYNQMNGEQFAASINQGENDSPNFKGYIPESANNYWRGKFRKMQRNGWASLWSTVSGSMRNQYAAGILTFFNNQTTGQDGQRESK